MEKPYYFFLILFIFISSCQEPNDKSAFEIISIENNDYYLATVPENIEYTLILLPGFSQQPESIYQESLIPELAQKNNILTIAFGNTDKIYADEAFLIRFNRFLSDADQRFSIYEKPIAIGGFSAGGTLALRIAEYCYSNPDKYQFKPSAVFTVDSPIDLFGLWKYLNSELDRNYSDIGMNEADYVLELLKKDVGSLPEATDTYSKLSPFNHLSDTLGNEKYLMDCAVRVYHDVDIPWIIENRRRSAFDTNYLYSSELISRLKLEGHDHAEFVQGETGYRSNGERHPHSWSIVEEEEFISWILKSFKSSPL